MITPATFILKKVLRVSEIEKEFITEREKAKVKLSLLIVLNLLMHSSITRISTNAMLCSNKISSGGQHYTAHLSTSKN